VAENGAQYGGDKLKAYLAKKALMAALSGGENQRKLAAAAA